MSNGLLNSRKVRNVFIYLVSLVSGILIIRKLGYVVGYKYTGYMRGNVHRIFSILAIEWLMLHLNYIIYQNFFDECSDENNVTNRRKNRIILTISKKVFFIIAVCVHLTYLMYLVPHSGSLIMAVFWITSILNGFWIHVAFFSLILLLFNLVTPFIMPILSFLPNWINFFTNRMLQRKSTLVCAIILSSLQFYYSDKLVVKNLDIYFKNRHINPLSVAVVTDVHAGAAVYQYQIANVVNTINNLDVDAVFLVGDIVDAPRGLIESRLEPLKNLKARKGVYYVTGNHDYYYGDVEEWFDLFKSYDIKCLLNEAIKIDDYCVLGLNDITAEESGIMNHTMDITAMNNCSPEDATIILAHNPKAVDKIISYANLMNHQIHLIISGHTHNGQIFVLTPLVYLISPYLHGIYKVNDGKTQLLVSAGTLYQNMPMKIPNNAEIWILNIKSSQ